MDIPDVTVTAQQLRRNNGDRGAPKWIAHQGIVYDVSECGRWRREMHEDLHFPGQDLTSEFPAHCEKGRIIKTDFMIDFSSE